MRKHSLKLFFISYENVGQLDLQTVRLNILNNDYKHRIVQNFGSRNLAKFGGYQPIHQSFIRQQFLCWLFCSQSANVLSIKMLMGSNPPKFYTFKVLCHTVACKQVIDDQIRFQVLVT